MDCRAPTDRNENSCILIVTVMNHCDEWISRKEAFKWAFGIFRNAAKDADMILKGDLQKVIPLRATVSGMQLNLHVVGVPDQLMSSVIIPAFEKEGQVAKLSKDQEELDKAKALSKAGDASKRAQAIGDVASVNSTIERLMALRGDGGTHLKKRRFAENCAHLLERTQRFGASGMREMREDARDTEE